MELSKEWIREMREGRNSMREGSAGFRIHRIVEPAATKQAAEDYPELEDELRVPNFIIYLLGKPE